MLFCHAAVQRKIGHALANSLMFGIEQTSLAQALIVWVITALLVNAPPATVQYRGKNQRYCARGDSVTSEQPNEWQKWYQAALLELDPVQLPERIEQAYRAIHIHMDVAGSNCSTV
jgi:hypothetical protein